MEEAFGQVVNQTGTAASSQNDNTTTTNAINVLQTINEEGLLSIATPPQTEEQDNVSTTPPLPVGDTSSEALGGTEGGGGLTPRPVKHRPTFTEDQITSMERIFSQRQYLSPIERETLAGSVSLSPQQVRVWFQNRRQKVKQFLTQRQIKNGPLFQNGEKQDNSVDAIITAQQLSSNIDPILQMLLPKVTAVNNATTEEQDEEIKKKGGGEGEEGDGIKTNQQQEEDKEEPMEESSSAPNLNLSPSQISLTPFLLPLSGMTPTIQLTGGGGSGNITIPAIQFLQSILSSSLPIGKINTKTSSPNKAPQMSGGSSVPLKATSPTPIGDIDEEGTEIKSEETNNVPLPSDKQTTSLELAPPTSSELAPPTSSLESKAEACPLQTEPNPVLTTVSSEILQQLLNLTPAGSDGLKTTWNLSVSPSQSGSISGGGVTATPTGITIDIPRRKRQVFSGIQTTELEKQFETCAYIDSKERDKLAERIDLHPDQVKVWFQNRRTKRSRQSWRQQKNALEQ